MAVRKKRPPSVRKLLVQAMTSAELIDGNFEIAGSTAWLPTHEGQVNQFIAERTQLWRTSNLVQPLKTAIALIDQDAKND
jgi:hypothetical protein